MLLHIKSYLFGDSPLKSPLQTYFLSQVVIKPLDQTFLFGHSQNNCRAVNDLSLIDPHLQSPNFKIITWSSFSPFLLPPLPYHPLLHASLCSCRSSFPSFLPSPPRATLAGGAEAWSLERPFRKTNYPTRFLWAEAEGRGTLLDIVSFRKFYNSVPFFESIAEGSTPDLVSRAFLYHHHRECVLKVVVMELIISIF